MTIKHRIPILIILGLLSNIFYIILPAHCEKNRIETNHQNYFDQGRLFLKDKEYQKAIAAFRKAVKLKPDYFKGYAGWQK